MFLSVAWVVQSLLLTLSFTLPHIYTVNKGTPVSLHFAEFGRLEDQRDFTRKDIIGVKYAYDSTCVVHCVIIGK